MEGRAVRIVHSLSRRPMRRVLAPLLLLILLLCATDGAQHSVRVLVQRIQDPRAFELSERYGSLPPPPEIDIYLTDLRYWQPTTRSDSLAYEQGKQRARRIEADSVVLREYPMPHSRSFGPQSETVLIVTRALERCTGKKVRFAWTEDVPLGLEEDSFWYGYDAVMEERLQPMVSVEDLRRLLSDAFQLIHDFPLLLLEKQRWRTLIHAAEPVDRPSGKDYVALVNLTVSDEGRVLRNDTRVVEVASARACEWSGWLSTYASQPPDAAPIVTDLVRRQTNAWTFAPISPEWIGLGVERKYHSQTLLCYGSW